MGHRKKSLLSIASIHDARRDNSNNARLAISACDYVYAILPHKSLFPSLHSLFYCPEFAIVVKS